MLNIVRDAKAEHRNTKKKAKEQKKIEHESRLHFW